MKDQLTAIIVSFYRHEYLEKCLESMRRQYPDINIIVGNNGNSDERKQEMCKQYNAIYQMLPYDCGVCVARNRLVEMVQTPYILIGDDDFYYEQEANVGLMLKYCEQYSLDLLGGRIREGGEVKNYQGCIVDHGNHFVYNKLLVDDMKAYQECGLTFNYFVARTEAVKDTKWDEEIKVAYEHSTFFIDFKRKGYIANFCPQAIVTHKPRIIVENNEEHVKYREYRNRKNDKKRFFDKYGIDYTITMNGNKDVYDRTGMDKIDFLITTFERKECLERLLMSIAEYCPSAHISIADQSKYFDFDYYKELWKKVADAGLIHKPRAYNCGFDTGLSYCRNFLVEKTYRDYKLILEDDFIFNQYTKIDKMLEKLEDNPKYSMIGGAVKENGHELDFVHDFEIDGDTLYHREVNKGLDFWVECDCIPNFFIAKKEVFKDVLWDELIKINGEHSDFFLRLYSVGTRILYCNKFEVDHFKPRDVEYKKFRDRKDGLVRLLTKHGLKRMVYKNGHCYELDGENIKSYSNYNN